MTNLRSETHRQLYETIQRGLFETYDAAIEAAVERLYEENKETPEEEYARKKKALDEVCGIVSLGLTRESWLEAEEDRLAYEVRRNTKRRD
jgi:hypothetical protein